MQGVTGAQLFVLHHKIKALGGAFLPELFGAMADNQNPAVAAKLTGQLQGIADQWPSGQGVEHLGQIGAHPGSLAGSQND